MIPRTINYRRGLLLVEFVREAREASDNPLSILFHENRLMRWWGLR